jgi:ornithine decarboxylase
MNALHPVMNDRIDYFLKNSDPPTPFLVVDLATVRSRYLTLSRALPMARIYYAAKANPLPEVVCTLADAGSCFDVAGEEELEQCLALGISADRISFGNTIKKTSAIGLSCFESIERIVRCAELGARNSEFGTAIVFGWPIGFSASKRK